MSTFVTASPSIDFNGVERKHDRSSLLRMPLLKRSSSHSQERQWCVIYYFLKKEVANEFSIVFNSFSSESQVELQASEKE